jgi:uroporphyrin-III C-methyltransferase/precorrin-2 dehydrogenase/sirohydrochlorin ferrochelatase
MGTPSEPQPGARPSTGPSPGTPATGAAATPPTPGPAATPTPGPAATPTPPTPAAAPPIYPLSLRLEGRRALVVGGGPVALRRVAGLREAGAEIVVVAPWLTPALADLADRGQITAHRRGYQPGDLDGAWLVLACTDQPGVNEAVAAAAERQHLWCGRADDAAASAAWVPAVGRAGAVTVAVNAGRNPRRAAELRDSFLEAVGTVDRSSLEGQEPTAGGQRAPGRVSIVGGGPGDPGLITVTGLRRLREADVVVADRLAPLALLEQLAPGVQVVDAAKVPGGPAMRQDHINQALVEHARAGRAVVRLKGGDPFVFGRGREEVEACLTAGVPVEVVPGVTSATSVPAAAGIPVTHRGVSQGFCVLAGHVRPGDSRSSVDWVALARSGMTLVLLMSIDHLVEIAGTLIAAGLGGGTPGAVVSDGWSRQQRVVTAPLRELAGAVRAAGVTNPAVVVIGDVAELATTGLLLPAAPDSSPSRGAPSPARPTSMDDPGPPPAGPTSMDDPGPPPAGPTSMDDPGPRPAEPISMDDPGPPPAEPISMDDPGPPPAAPISFESAAPSLATPRPGRRVLVLGGARSGKSATAEGMLAGDGPVDYIATGAPPGSGDAEWDARVAEHKRRRPPPWRTVETLALAEVLAAPGPAPVLVDCLTTWLARVMDDCGAWDDAEGSAWVLADRIEQVLHAWRHTRRQVIAVSNEIGSGVVPDTASGRRFRDELGQLNARIAADSDEVWLCTAGIARRLR